MVAMLSVRQVATMLVLVALALALVVVLAVSAGLTIGGSGGLPTEQARTHPWAI